MEKLGEKISEKIHITWSNFFFFSAIIILDWRDGKDERQIKKVRKGEHGTKWVEKFGALLLRRMQRD